MEKLINLNLASSGKEFHKSMKELEKYFPHIDFQTASITHQIGILKDPLYYDNIFKLDDLKKKNLYEDSSKNDKQKGKIHSIKSKVLSGSDLDMLSSDDWKVLCTHYDEIILRMSPHQKNRCIKEFQLNGNTIAMVGDRINDSPALKNVKKIYFELKTLQ